MMKIYMPFYFEWAQILDHLPDADYGKLIKLILAFAMGKEHRTAKLSPEARLAYRLITSSIARAEEKRCGNISVDEGKLTTSVKKEKKKFKRSEKYAPKNGQKADASPTNTDKNGENAAPPAKKEQITCAIRHEDTTNPQNQPQNADNITAIQGAGVKDAAGDAERDVGKDEARDVVSAKKSAPTKEQVRNFFKNREFKSNPDEFFNFYESNGWLVGQNPMQNWHSSAENWELRAKREQKPIKSEQSPPRYGDYDIHEVFKLALERSYGSMDEDDEDEEGE